MKKVKKLISEFQPESYELSFLPSQQTTFIGGTVKITGKKVGRPSKRIILHQKGLKVSTATITRRDKKLSTDRELSRINHLPSFEQVRLHAKDMLYPGQYIVELNYTISPKTSDALSKLKQGPPDRTLVPSIDEPEAWAKATFESK